jgi:UDP-3-O-[3-hydroxymyristoyl] glucosamine N-acyltransferase
MVIRLDEIAKAVNGVVIGDSSTEIFDVSKIEEAVSGTITFIANDRYMKYLSGTGASAVIVSRSITSANTNLVQVDDPYRAFREVILLLHPVSVISENFIHPTALIANTVHITPPVYIGAFSCIEENVQIGKYTFIGAQAYIGRNVSIGENVYIHPKVAILADCSIGNRVIIHSGAVIGSDGFGYVKENGKYLKIPQLGSVVIDDDAEIGANTTIDRATVGKTYVGKGCKLDNLVQIAHNVIIGEDTAIAAQTGISGSTKIRPRVTMGGQAGIAGHIEVGENSIIGAQSGVTKSLPKDSFCFGTPARDHLKTKIIEALLHRLPELFNRVKQLESNQNKNSKQ